MSKTNKRFDNIIVGIQNNCEDIHNVTKETAKFSHNLRKITIKLSIVSLKHINETAEINKYLEEVVKGKLLPFLYFPTKS